MSVLLCSPVATEGAGRHPAPGNHQTNQPNRASVSVLCLESLPSSVPEIQGTCLTAPGGQSLSKKEAYHARLKVLRAMPGRCRRCARESALRTCGKCADYFARYRASKRSVPITVETAQLDALTRRVASLEHAVALLQAKARDAFQRGYRSGQRGERKARFAESPEISFQELSTMNHAYGRRIGGML